MAAKQSNYTATHYGLLKGHTDWVTKICVSPIDPDTIITASRDKSILIWKLYGENGELCGKLKKSLVGHNHFVSDCSISKDGGFLISSSWDKTIRLWDINRGVTKRIFNGHSSDVTSLVFSSDNRQIVSGSRDNTVRLWNTLAIQKYVFVEDGHDDCVSSVLTVPQTSSHIIVSAGWDRVIKVWSLSPPRCVTTFRGHSNAINSLSMGPDGSLLASGSKDSTINVWDFPKKALLKKYQTGGPVNCVAFNPCFFILAAAVGPAIQFFNVTTHEMYLSLTPIDIQDQKWLPTVTSISWSNDGIYLFAGYSDSKIRVFFLRETTST